MAGKLCLTFDVPSSLPQSYPTLLQKAYLRDCYLNYYDEIHGVMTRDDSKVTKFVLTSTPGIGKSIFYLYFFARYSKMHPSEKIVCASFSRERKLIECKLYDPTTVELGKAKWTSLDKVPSNRPDVSCVHFYDGIPERFPSPQITMVSFSSPNMEFLAELADKFVGTNMVRYMPNWTLKEQVSAVESLDLKIPIKLLRKRWSYFGVTVRYTLTSVSEDRQEAAKRILSALETIRSYKELKAMFQGTCDDDLKVPHRILHFQVSSQTDTEGRLKPSSRHIAHLIASKLDKDLLYEREKLLLWLDGVGRGSSLVGWIFENLSHESLKNGLLTEMRELGKGTTTTSTTFELAAESNSYKRFGMEKTFEEIFEDAYRIPESHTTLRSIDSYYLSNDVLYLFQITNNVDHAVSIEGLIEIVKSLGVWEKFLLDETFVRLVFVVPKKLFHDFPIQKFHTASIFSASGVIIKTYPCEAVPGIGSHKKRKLEAMGIKTVGDLLDATENQPENLTAIRSIVATFKKNLDETKDHNCVQKMKQFVIGLPYNPEDVAPEEIEGALPAFEEMEL